MKPLGSKPLKLTYGKAVSSFAFKFNWRRYTLVDAVDAARQDLHQLWDVAATVMDLVRVPGRALHSLTSLLNLRTFGTHRSRQS